MTADIEDRPEQVAWTAVPDLRGALPVGLSDVDLGEALLAYVEGPNRRRAHVLPSWCRRLLWRRDWPALRARLDAPAHRDELRECDFGIHQVLLLAALRRRGGRTVHTAFFEPAEVSRGDHRAYLDPARFASVVAANAERLAVPATGHVEHGSDLETFLVLGLAYALLQRSQAREILRAAASLGASVKAWLGMQPVRRPGAPAVGEAPDGTSTPAAPENDGGLVASGHDMAPEAAKAPTPSTAAAGPRCQEPLCVALDRATEAHETARQALLSAPSAATATSAERDAIKLLWQREEEAGREVARSTEELRQGLATCSTRAGAYVRVLQATDECRLAWGLLEMASHWSGLDDALTRADECRAKCAALGITVAAVPADEAALATVVADWVRRAVESIDARLGEWSRQIVALTARAGALPADLAAEQLEELVTLGARSAEDVTDRDFDRLVVIEQALSAIESTNANQTRSLAVDEWFAGGSLPEPPPTTGELALRVRAATAEGLGDVLARLGEAPTDLTALGESLLACAPRIDSLRSLAMLLERLDDHLHPRVGSALDLSSRWSAQRPRPDTGHRILAGCAACLRAADNFDTEQTAAIAALLSTCSGSRDEDSLAAHAAVELFAGALAPRGPRTALATVISLIENARAIEPWVEGRVIAAWLRAADLREVHETLAALLADPSFVLSARQSPRWTLLLAVASIGMQAHAGCASHAPSLLGYLADTLPATAEALRDSLARKGSADASADPQFGTRTRANELQRKLESFRRFHAKKLTDAANWWAAEARPLLEGLLARVLAGRATNAELRRFVVADWVRDSASRHQLEPGSPLYKSFVAAFGDWVDDLRSLQADLGGGPLREDPPVVDALEHEWRRASAEPWFEIARARLVEPALRGEPWLTSEEVQAVPDASWLKLDGLEDHFFESAEFLAKGSVRGRAPSGWVDRVRVEAAELLDPAERARALAERGRIGDAGRVAAAAQDGARSELMQDIAEWEELWHAEIAKRKAMTARTLDGIARIEPADTQLIRAEMHKVEQAVQAKRYDVAEAALTEAEFYASESQADLAARSSRALEVLSGAFEAVWAAAARGEVVASPVTFGATVYLLRAAIVARLSYSSGTEAPSRLLDLATRLNEVLRGEVAVAERYASLAEAEAPTNLPAALPPTDPPTAMVQPLASVAEKPSATESLYSEALARASAEPTVALTFLELLLKREPGRPDAVLLRARLLVEQRRPAEALVALRTLPDGQLTADAVLLRAHAHRRLRDWASTREAVHRGLLLGVRPDQELDLHRDGFVAARAQGEIGAARGHLEAMQNLGEDRLRLEVLARCLDDHTLDLDAELARAVTTDARWDLGPMLDREAKNVDATPVDEPEGSYLAALARKRPRGVSPSESLAHALAIRRLSQGRAFASDTHDLFRVFAADAAIGIGTARIESGSIDSGLSLIVHGLGVLPDMRFTLTLGQAALGRFVDALVPGRPRDVVSVADILVWTLQSGPEQPEAKVRAWAMWMLELFSRCSAARNEAMSMRWESLSPAWSELARVAHHTGPAGRVGELTESFRRVRAQGNEWIRTHTLDVIRGRSAVGSPDTLADLEFCGADIEAVRGLVRVCEDVRRLDGEASFRERELLERSCLETVEQIEDGVRRGPTLCSVELLRLLAPIRSGVLERRRVRLRDAAPQIVVSVEAARPVLAGLEVDLCVKNQGRLPARNLRLTVVASNAASGEARGLETLSEGGEKRARFTVVGAGDTLLDAKVELVAKLEYEVETAQGTFAPNSTETPLVTSLRLRPFAWIESPFRVEGTLQDPKLFKGRWRVQLVESLCARVVQRGETVAHLLLGQMRSGKSSLLSRIAASLRERGVCVVELGRPQAGLDATIEAIAASTISALRSAGIAPPAVIETRATVEAFGGPVAVFRRLFREARQLAVAPVVLIDELQDLSGWADPNEAAILLRLFKELIDDHRVSVVYAANDSGVELADRFPNELAVSGRLWMKWFAPEDSRDLVEEALRFEDGESRLTSPGVVARLHELAGGNPWHLQYLGLELVSFLNARRLVYAAPMHVDEMVDSLLKLGGSTFDPVDRFHNLPGFVAIEGADRSSRSREERLLGHVLCYVAVLALERDGWVEEGTVRRRCSFLGVGDSELTQTLRALEGRLAIEREAGRVRVVVGLLGEWLRRRRRLESLEDGLRSLAGTVAT